MGKLLNEVQDDAVFLITACIILYNMCLENGDSGEDFLVEEVEEVRIEKF